MLPLGANGNNGSGYQGSVSHFRGFFNLSTGVSFNPDVTIN